MKREIKYIVIHCTAGNKNQTVESIKHWWHSHPEGPKWKSVGYHFLVLGDGKVVQLADLQQVTNGVRGFNKDSAHIAYTGGIKEDDRTELQKAGILDCIYKILEYCKLHGFKPEIKGHRDFPRVKKSCPQFNAKKEYSWITV